VMLSAEATPILIHDETWERTTNGRGRVSDTRDAALAALDAGSWFGPDFAGEPVPTFEAAARLCRELGLAANVEIKPATGFEEITGRVVAQAADRLWHGAALPPLLSSFSELALSAAAETAPHLPRGLLVGAIPPDWLARMARHGCLALHCDAAANGLERLAGLAAGGIPVVCYTVNDEIQARLLLDAGVATVITDRLDIADRLWFPIRRREDRPGAGGPKS
ncbi:MAG: glycerophosphodiester phosphodiesterase family protein, partial [Rhodocyclaceae bacterium]